jgi:hypothetical protein
MGPGEAEDAGGGGFDPSYFAALSTIEDTHFWFVTRNELIAALIDRYVPNARAVFELGCGNGAAALRPWERIV